MNIVKLSQLIMKLSSLGVDLGKLDQILSDRGIQLIVDRVSALQRLNLDGEDPDSIKGLLQIFNISLPLDRIERIADAMLQEGISGNALSVILDGQLLRLLRPRDQDGVLAGQWVRDENGESYFEPASALSLR